MKIKGIEKFNDAKINILLGERYCGKHFIYSILYNLKEENAILKKALELACVPRDDWTCKEPKRTKYTSNYDYFIEQAKESLK